MAGYDGIIVTGAANKWVYLWIDDDKVELRDAEKFVGKDTHETEDLIKEDLGVNIKIGAPDGASVAAIGPAGEHLCAGSAIMNDKKSWVLPLRRRSNNGIQAFKGYRS